MRKWVVNGCAYYEEGSDTNVASIEKKNKAEKEIEDLNDFADLLRPEQRYYTNLIKRVIEERLKDREKIKELEEENKKKQVLLVCAEEIIENSIPVQKVKEILDKAYVMDYYTLPNVIKDLEELLEDK